MSEYLAFIEEHSGLSVEFNSQLADRGMPILLVEARNVRPDNYDINNLSRFSKVYSWNRRFLSLLSPSIPTAVVSGFPLFDNHSWLDEFRPIKQRIHGMCLIATKMKRVIEGDISENRETVFAAIEGIEKHAFGRIPLCGEHYRGPIGTTRQDTYPSSLAKLKKLNEYKFNLCFENCYHPLWSYDYLTEKIFDSFRAKTIPIYLGCFNVEELVPTDLFIDFRRFESFEQLSDYLIHFPDDQFVDMTERAYEWVKRSSWGDVARLRQQLAEYRTPSATYVAQAPLVKNSMGLT